MILNSIIILTLLSFILMLLIEADFIQHFEYNLDINPLESQNYNSNVVGFINDLKQNCVLLIFSKSKFQNDTDPSSENRTLEIDKNINILKKNLRQNLETLNYIFRMESNFKGLETEGQKLELHSLRGILRNRVAELTKELQHYKSLKMKNIMVEYEEVV